MSIPGLPVLMGIPGITEILQQDSASSTGDTITWPAVQSGDIAVLFDFAQSISPAPSSVTPAGFTNMCNATDGVSSRGMTSFKICDGSETGNITGMSGAVLNRKALVTFRATAAAVVALGADGENGAVATGNPSAITINASSGVPPLLVVGYYRSSGAIDPRTFTAGGSPAKDGEISFHSNTMYVAWKVYLENPADVVIDMDDEGDFNLVQGFYVALS